MTTLKQVRFEKPTPDGFYLVLKKRVDNYFNENNISKNANGLMIFKTIFIISMVIITYAVIISNTVTGWPLLALVAVNGFFTAMIGLNIAHDAIHGAYSSSTKVNKAIGLTFNLIGANDYMWDIMHNSVHHMFTNIPDHDADIDQPPIIRTNPHQDLWWIHRFQHIYVFFIYPLASISWVFIKDYVKFFSPQIGNYKMNKKPKFAFLRMLAFKLLYYTIFLVIPMIVIDLPWHVILGGFFFMHFVEGITLALVFQLGHVVEGTQFPEPNPDSRINTDWAAHQMYTSANFANNNFFANFFTGGLNFQIEHHLFPKVCHIHYKKIKPIVMQTAKEFNLPYIENKTFFGALGSHVRLMKRFGRSVTI